MTTTAALAFWARTNRLHARFLIAFATTGLVLTASALGNLWADAGLRMGPGILAGIFAVYLLVFPLYPLARRRATWMRRKVFDAVLIGCTAVLGVWLGVQEVPPRLLIEGSPASAAAVHIPAATPSSASHTPARRFERRVQQGMSLLRAVFHRPARFGDPVLFDTVAKVCLTVLAVVLAVGLMYLVFAISCSLSCSGNAVGGTLVLTLGGVGVIALLTLAVIRIFRGQRWAERRASRGGQ